MMRGQLTIERTTVFILLLMLFALATRIPLDTDTWWHLRAGEWMVENGQVIAGDPFSYTAAGVVRVPADWLSQVILYSMWATLGYLGLALFTSVLATAGIAALFYASEGSTYLRAFVMVLGAATAAVFWSARPQMFTFFLSAVIVYLLYLYKRRQVDRLWLIVPVMLLWANLHGGYFLGLILLYGTVAGEILNYVLRSRSPFVIAPARLRKLGIVAVIGTGVVLLNPAGVQLLLLPLQTFTLGPLRQFIQEWNPPDFTTTSVFPFLALLFAVIVVIALHYRKLDWTEVLLVAGAGYLAVTAARNIAFFAVAATPILTYHLNAEFERRGWVLQTVKRPTPSMVRLNAVLLVVVAVGSLAKVLLVLDPTLVASAEKDIFPVEATAYLNRERPEGRMFNSYNWGGYLMYHAPEYPVYVDGRTDLYGDLVLDYARIAFESDGWQQEFDRRGVNLVFIETESSLAQTLEAESGWRAAYTDEIASVFVRE